MLELLVIGSSYQVVLKFDWTGHSVVSSSPIPTKPSKINQKPSPPPHSSPCRPSSNSNNAPHCGSPPPTYGGGTAAKPWNLDSPNRTQTTDAPLNVTFIRAPSNALLKVDIPIVYRGEDISPGLRKGAYLNTIKRTVKYLCPADVIPPFIDVDLSELDVGQKLVMGDLKVHPALKLLQSKEEPVCKIMGARVSDQKKSK
ncbi:hypothetical protein SO802_013383 [Lithocarpus litseifolius]|uniref:Large ribosomal subunit protein bL25 beta domain-containing protein n=1 Tax=Lithocarpus litseifolius TaxID=425828 RepID=A0AAW2D7N1_9ROSI